MGLACLGLAEVDSGCRVVVGSQLCLACHGPIPPALTLPADVPQQMGEGIKLQVNTFCIHGGPGGRLSGIQVGGWLGRGERCLPACPACLLHVCRCRAQQRPRDGWDSLRLACTGLDSSTLAAPRRHAPCGPPRRRRAR